MKCQFFCRKKSLKQKQTKKAKKQPKNEQKKA